MTMSTRHHTQLIMHTIKVPVMEFKSCRHISISMRIPPIPQRLGDTRHRRHLALTRVTTMRSRIMVTMVTKVTKVMVTAMVMVMVMVMGMDRGMGMVKCMHSSRSTKSLRPTKRFVHNSSMYIAPETYFLCSFPPLFNWSELCIDYIHMHIKTYSTYVWYIFYNFQNVTKS